MIEIKKDALYLVTGGSGFLGRCLIERIIKEGGQVRSFARNEGNLLKLQQDFPVEIISGDITDPFILRKALKNVRGVFHLAAFKHVGLSETQPVQCTASNVIGTLNLLRECENTFIDFFIAISSDKAAQVAGVYGATKLLMERMIKEYEQVNPSIDYRVVRYGNVLYSTGSVLTKWRELMKRDQEVIVTNLDVTRFYWSVDEAVDSIFKCMEEAIDSTPYCPSMKATGLRSLLKAMHNKYGIGELKYKEIGIQPGENLHEKVLDKGPFSNEVEQYSVEELIKMI